MYVRLEGEEACTLKMPSIGKNQFSLKDQGKQKTQIKTILYQTNTIVKTVVSPPTHVINGKVESQE
jgi:hypothetical protein